MGLRYLYGKGVRQNYAEALKWFMKAAEQEHALSQFVLGNCYANGEGVKQNPAEAVKWYQRSAANGNEKAAACLRAMGIEP